MNRERRWLVAGLAAAVSLAASAGFAQGPPPGKGPGPRWDQDAEQTFRMRRGMGRQLMTQAEWEKHREKMRSMMPEERSRYRDEMHKQMMARAKEKGITIPESPGPRGPEGPAPR